MQMSESKGEARNQELMKICSCGQMADLKGYCFACIEKLKKKHEYLVKKFEALNKEYEQFKPDDLQKQNQKMKLLQNKMAQYGVYDADMLDVIDKYDKLIPCCLSNTPWAEAARRFFL